MQFFDRQEAGKHLAKELLLYKDDNPLVFALPRGGVPLGTEIAKALDAPLGLIITRKIGHPHNPEYAIGAISEFGKTFYNQAERSQVSPQWLIDEEARLKNEIKRRRLRYKLPHHEAEGKTAILVDDGIATGYTMRAAIDDLKRQHPAKIIVAIPVVPEQMAQKLEKEVDTIVALERTRHYRGAIGAYYTVFDQLSDDDVIQLLKERG